MPITVHYIAGNFAAVGEQDFCVVHSAAAAACCAVVFNDAADHRERTQIINAAAPAKATTERLTSCDVSAFHGKLTGSNIHAAAIADAPAVPDRTGGHGEAASVPDMYTTAANGGIVDGLDDGTCNDAAALHGECTFCNIHTTATVCAVCLTSCDAAASHCKDSLIT